MKWNSAAMIYSVAISLILSLSISAQVPQIINYQALLTDPATGKAIPDSVYAIVFSIYDTQTGGTALWTETQNVQTQNGLFNALLGSVTPLTPSIMSGAEKYLGIKVGVDAEMTPRQRIVSSAYSILSEEADKLDGLNASDFSTSDGNPPNQGTNLVSWDNLADVPAGFADGIDDAGPAGAGNTLDQAYDQSGPGAGRTITADAGAVNISGADGLTINGKVGIGTTLPTGKLEVIGDVNISGISSSVAFKVGQSGDASVIVPQNSINAAEMLNEPGVASNVGSGVILNNGFNVLLSRTIVCPTAGYVLVIGTCESSFSHVSGVTSNARFGVSNISNSFPSNQDVELRVSSAAPTAAYNFPVTGHGLFQVNSGSNSFYFLAQEVSGDFNVFDSQLSLIFLPTAYGTVTPTIAGGPSTPQEEIAKSSPMSSNQMEAERRESEAFYRSKVDEELAKMKAEIEIMKKEMENQKDQDDQ